MVIFGDGVWTSGLITTKNSLQMVVPEEILIHGIAINIVLYAAALGASMLRTVALPSVAIILRLIATEMLGCG
jgi:NADH:ubiquinone oxidoreductase subunit K